MKPSRRLPFRKKISPALEPLEQRKLLSITPVTENHYNPTNDGQDSTETLLTPTNVNATDFGKIFDTPVDGQIYAQPLAVPNVDITTSSNPGIHNVIYVATMNDSLYAIDATTGAILWHDSFLNISDPTDLTPTAGVFAVPGNSSPGLNAFVNGSDIGPELGILSTPTIDTATNTLYLAADTQEVRSGSTPVAGTTISGATTLQANVTADIGSGFDIHYVQRIWAVNLSNGKLAITPSNPPIEPTSGGEVFADTIFNSVNFSKYGQNPNNTGGPGYLYVAGPYVKGTGNNNPAGATTAVPGDGWGVNSADTTSPWGALSETPTEDNFIAFNAVLQMGRTALTLVNGEIFYGFASHGDNGPYYGWLLGWNASTLVGNVAWVAAPTYENFNTVSGDRSTYDSQAGFWNSGSQITTDGTYLYISSGNGAFNPNPSNFNSTFTSTDDGNTVQLPLDDDYGDAVLKLKFDPSATQNNINIADGIINNPNGTYTPDSGYNANGYGLKVVDYFVPSNVYELNQHDGDIGSGGVTLIPSTNPQGQNWLSDGDSVLVTGGKEGRIYALDSGNLGGFNTQYISDGDEFLNTDPSTFDNVVGEYYYYDAANPGTPANNGNNQVFDIPSYYDGNIYVGLAKVQAFEIPVASLITGTSPPDTATAAAASAVSTSTTFASRGTTVAVSSDGTSDSIVWAMNVSLNSSDDLLAYNFTGVAAGGTVSPIYDTQTDSSRDSLTNVGTIPGSGNSGATGTKFTIPTVFNGMVYAGTGGGSGAGADAEGTLVGYGLLPSFVQSSSNFAAPTNLSATLGSNAINLTWQINSADEDEFAVQRSTNGGGSWATLAFVQHGVNSFSDTDILSGTTYEYRVQGISGGTITLPATGNATTDIGTAFTNTQTVPTFATLTDGTLSINGTAGNDSISVTDTDGSVVATLNGVASPSVNATDITVGISISGGAGNDTITVAGVSIASTLTGAGGDDLLTGGGGNDSIRGGGGNDTLGGAAGDDIVVGGAENDCVKGGDGNDSVAGGPGNDILHGGAGNDSLNGGIGDDTVNGNLGDDTILAGSGNSQLFAGPGSDSIIGSTTSGYLPDSIYCGGSTDTIQAGTDDQIFDSVQGDSITGGQIV